MTIPIVGGWCIYPKLMTSSETSASVGARSPAARMSRWDLPPLQRERCPHAPGNSNSVASAGGFSEPARARSVDLKIVEDEVVKTKKTMIDLSDSFAGFASNKETNVVSLTMPMMVGSRPSAAMLTS